jgi:hypothetical protein
MCRLDSPGARPWNASGGKRHIRDALDGDFAVVVFVLGAVCDDQANRLKRLAVPAPASQPSPLQPPASSLLQKGRLEAPAWVPVFSGAN